MLLSHDSASAGTLAGPAEMTRLANAFGPHRRRRRRTRVHAKAQFRLTGNHGRIADDAARLEMATYVQMVRERAVAAQD